MTCGDAQASSQHSQEGIPSVSRGLAPSQSHCQVWDRVSSESRGNFQEQVRTLGSPPSCSAGVSSLGTCQPRAELLWSQRRKGHEDLAPSFGTVTSLWQSWLGILPSDHSCQLPVLWKQAGSCFTFHAFPDGRQTHSVPLVLPRNGSKVLEMIPGQ